MTEAVAKRSTASKAMVVAGAKGRALMSGTDGMRTAGVKYLPKFPAESEEAYESRKASSWLFNGYRKSARDMAGKVFASSVELSSEYPSEFTAWERNIDNAGRDLSTFARDVFEDGLTGAGVGFIMVDAPARDGEVTRERAQAENLRPFLVHLRVEDVLGWRTETVANVTRLTQIRIAESVTVQGDDEFSEDEVEQVRVLDLIDGRVQVRLYQNGSAGWAMVGDPRLTEMDEITVVPFYANRTGFFTGSPLLDDLADVNIAHWQSQSDQRNILHFARVPFLFATGVADDEDFEGLGGGSLIKARQPDATLTVVEHSGAAIAAGRTDLKDLEFQMEALGLQLLTSQANTATGASIEASKETSTLAMTADQLKDALEQAMIWVGKYASVVVPANATVKVNKEYGVTALSPQMVQALGAAVAIGNLSKETYIAVIARGGVIPSDIDVLAEIQRITDEGNLGLSDGDQ